MVRTFATLEGGAFSGFVEDTLREEKARVWKGVDAASKGLQQSMRDDVAAASLGEKLGRAIGRNIYPRSASGSLQAAGVVYPRGKRAEQIFTAWNTGAVIVATGGRKYLAIPTPAAGKGVRGSLMTPAKFKDATGIALRFVPVKGKPNIGLLVGTAIKGRSGGFRKATAGRRAQGRSATDVVFFVLVRQAKIPAKLHFDRLAQEWADAIPGLIEAAG